LCGCASCSSGRGHATPPRGRRHQRPHHQCHSAIVSANPLRASPPSRIATPVRMPATSVQRPPAPPASPHRAHTGTPPPGGHLAAFLPQPGLCVSRLGRLGQSPRQRSSEWGLLAATAVRRLSPLFSRDPRPDRSRQARFRRVSRARHRVPGRRHGYPRHGASLRGGPEYGPPGAFGVMPCSG
jgi:hypothetical protein